MLKTLRPFGFALLAAGCSIGGGGGGGCESDPCASGSAPRFSMGDGELLAGPLRFPSDGSLEVRVDLTTDEAGRAGVVVVEGPFDLDKGERNTGMWDSEWYDVTIRASSAAAGALEATDSCGRTGRLELVSVPATNFVADVDIARAIDELPDSLTAGGVALLPELPITLNFTALDERGEKLAGAPAPPRIEVTGGLEISEPVKADSAVVRVVGPAGPASLGVVPGVPEPIGFEIADGSEGVRLEIWRNVSASDWIEGWTAAQPIGETLELQVGEVAVLALHPFDAEGRLLLGIDTVREPLPRPPSFLGTSRGLWLGDVVIRGTAPGAATVQFQKAGASGTLLVRVMEASR